MEEIGFILDSAKEKMEHTIEHLNKVFLQIRAGKANPAMLNSVLIDYYGSQTPLSQVANINTTDAMTLSVQPWEKKMLPEIERGIMMANLGLNPMNNGEVIIINIPPLTADRRKELVKQAKTASEDAKVSIRNARKEANNELKKIEGVSPDIIKDKEAEVQELTNKYSKTIEEYFIKKEKEIITV